MCRNTSDSNARSLYPCHTNIKKAKSLSWDFFCSPPPHRVWRPRRTCLGQWPQRCSEARNKSMPQAHHNKVHLGINRKTYRRTIPHTITSIFPSRAGLLSSHSANEAWGLCISHNNFASVCTQCFAKRKGDVLRDQRKNPTQGTLKSLGQTHHYNNQKKKSEMATVTCTPTCAWSSDINGLELT